MSRAQPSQASLLAGLLPADGDVAARCAGQTMTTLLIILLWSALLGLGVQVALWQAGYHLLILFTQLWRLFPACTRVRRALGPASLLWRRLPSEALLDSQAQYLFDLSDRTSRQGPAQLTSVTLPYKSSPIHRVCSPRQLTRVLLRVRRQYSRILLLKSIASRRHIVCAGQCL